MGLNLSNTETNDPIPTLAIIPPDDNLNGAEGNNTSKFPGKKCDKKFFQNHF